MPRVIAGGGSAQVLLELPIVPEVGDKIRVEESQIVEMASENALLMVGDTFLVSHKSATEIGGVTYPWVSLINARSHKVFSWQDFVSKAKELREKFRSREIETEVETQLKLDAASLLLAAVAESGDPGELFSGLSLALSVIARQTK